jgi:putative glutamine amidotransferase
MSKQTILFLIFLMPFIHSQTYSQSALPPKPLHIALSSGAVNYFNWIHRADPSVVCVDLKGLSTAEAEKLLETCDGILFTGGEDVVPSRYGKTADSARCTTNPARDSLEFFLIASAMQMKLPVLGVCRGMQILNVALGGTLVVDIPTERPGHVVHQCEDYLHCFHPVSPAENTVLSRICGSGTGEVTTNHHQCVERLADGYRISARSADGIPEAMEPLIPENQPFFLAVQWHPERMDELSPLSMPLMKAFLEASALSR